MDAHDLLAAVPDAVDRGAISSMNGTAQFDIARPVALRVRDGRIEVIEGRVDAPDVTIRAKDALLLDLFHGRASATAAFMTGRLKVKGDVGLAQRLISAVDRRRLGADLGGEEDQAG